MRRKVLLVSVLFLLMLFAAAPLISLPVNAEEAGAGESKVEKTDVSAPVTIFSDGFETGWSWTGYDANSASGYDYWGIVYDSGYVFHSGTHSAWCAAVSDHPYGAYKYDNYMNAYMYKAVPSGYTSLTLSYWYWTQNEVTNGIQYDFLKVVYWYNGVWYTVVSHGGSTNYAWKYESVSIPSYAQYVGFNFYSDYSNANYFGSYIDDVTLTGTPPGYSVTIWAWCASESQGWISRPIYKNGVYTGYYTPHVFTDVVGTNTWSVPLYDALGHVFYEWSTGSTSTTITVSSTGTYTARYHAVVTLLPYVEIWTNKVSYAKGETLTAYIQGFNPGPATPVRVNVWFGLPGGGTYLYQTYWTGTIPGYYTSPVYIWKSVTIPYSAASGTYSVNAEMRNPSTNALIDSDIYYFIIS